MTEVEKVAQPGADGRLYILARTDIPQMNPGKLAAQVAHAATKFVFDTLAHGSETDNNQMDGWRKQAGGGFGTKIVLAATEEQIQEIVGRQIELWAATSGFVIDPTYPMFNFLGEVFTRPELTCGYIFVPSMDDSAVLTDLRELSLYQ